MFTMEHPQMRTFIDVLKKGFHDCNCNHDVKAFRSYNYNCMIWLSQCFHDCNCNYNVKAFDVFHIAISLAAEFVYNDMDL